MSATARLILASRSPQRRAILAQAGIEFTVVVADVPELADGDPAALTVENAERKARAVDAPAGALVLGVDTVVWCAGRVYGKPADELRARETLTALGGRTHTVVSGLCLRGPAGERTATTRTQVCFRTLSAQLLDWYLASGEWRERAGGYAIQGRGAALISRIEGDYLNVVGLPLVTLLELEPSILGVG